MPNPILEQINNNRSATTTTITAQNPTDTYIQGLRQFAQNIKNSPNPQTMLQNMILQNPRFKDAMSLIQSMNNPEQALVTLAKQKGLNPDQILNAIKNLQ